MGGSFSLKTWLATTKSAVGLFTETARNWPRFAAPRLFTPQKSRKRKWNFPIPEYTRSRWTFFCTSTEAREIFPTPSFLAQHVEQLGPEWFPKATKTPRRNKTRIDEVWFPVYKSFNYVDSWSSLLFGCVFLWNSTLENFAVHFRHGQSQWWICADRKFFGIKMIHMLVDALRRYTVFSQQHFTKSLEIT